MTQFFKRLFCTHSHRRFLYNTRDGVAVYECAYCGKHIKRRW